MEQMDLFSAFGNSLDGFESLMPKASAPVAEQKKDEKQKKEAKKKATKAGKDTGSDVDITLPVNVYGRNFHLTLDGSGSKKGVEILETLEKDYAIHELKVKGMKAVFVDSVNTIFLCDYGVLAEEPNTVVSLPVTVADGGLCATYEQDNFEDVADNNSAEVTLTDILEKWVDTNPSYKGCELAYNPEAGVAYPVWKKQGASFMEVFYGGTSYVTDGETVADTIVKKLFGNSFPISAEIVGKETAYISFRAYKNAFNLKDASGRAKTQVAEVKYALPLNVFVATWGETYLLEPTHFGGKTSVKLDEVKQKLAENYPVCACLLDTNRKVDAIYLKELNKLSVMLVSGTKGSMSCEVERYGIYKLLRTAKELAEVMSNPTTFHGVYCPDAGESMKVDVYPHGVFLGTFGKAKECCTVKSLSFKRRLPKIPRSCLDGIVSYFQSQLPNEAIVKVCFNRGNGEFYFVRGVGAATGASIHYNFDITDFSLPNIVQVMEIHSHGKFPAGFSEKDNADEKGIPGVFGVVGNVDTDAPTFAFRAGNDGVFSELSLSDIFE